MPADTLFVTVGGSPQPIVTAIRQHRPARVVFVCSEDDPVSGRPGSSTQVVGTGKVCTSGRDAPPDLPNIPTQLGLAPDAFELVTVPADDPVTAAERLAEPIRVAAARGAVVADYTGGTKSMSAALFLAALQQPGVDVSLVGGPRLDLVRVADGTESVRRVEAGGARRRWRLLEAERAWARHAYQEAVYLLEAEQSDDAALQRLLLLSRGLAAWDAFDHARAYGLLRPFAATLPPGLMAALARLRDHAADRAREAEALRIWDLRLMADRRAVAGRFDTGVLVLYRALEWIAQWALRFDHGVSTDDVPAEVLGGLGFAGHDGRRKLGLHEAWRAVARLGGPLAETAARTERARLDFLKRRNESLYAHGRTPVRHADFDAARDWLDREVMPAFIEHAFRGCAPFPQLPDVP